MEKEIVKKNVMYLRWYRNGDIEQIKKDIKDAKKCGATHIIINSCDSTYSDPIEVNAVSIKEETDEQYNERIRRISWYNKRNNLSSELETLRNTFSILDGKCDCTELKNKIKSLESELLGSKNK